MKNLNLLFKNERFFLFKNPYGDLFCLDLLEGFISQSIVNNYPFALDEDFFKKLEILTKQGHSWDNYPQEENAASFMENFYTYIKNGDEIILEFEREGKQIKIIDYDYQKYLSGCELNFVEFLNYFMNKDLDNYFQTIEEDIVLSKITNKKFKITLSNIDREFLTEYVVLDLLTNREFKYYFVPVKYYIMDSLVGLSATMEELMDMAQIEYYLVKRILKDNPARNYNDDIKEFFDKI